MANLNWKQLLAILLFIKLLLHLATNTLWSFHRDELLYSALGRHLDWGYASVPPGVAFWAWINDLTTGGSLFGLRLISTLVGTGTVALTALMAIDMLPPDPSKYSGRFAVTTIGLAGLLSGAFMRPCMLFMPVVFDVFYWTLLCYLFLKYMNCGKQHWLWWFGVAAGIGLLNKYSVLILLAAMVPGVVFTRQRKLFKNPNLYLAAGIALVILSPNIWWHYQHDFPVVRHIGQLAASQFVHVSLGSFFSDQLRFFLPALPVWLFGLGFLLRHPVGRTWRIYGWMFIGVLAILLVFSAKSYYSLGAYPVLIAAGAVHLERLSVTNRKWIRPTLPVLMLVIGLPILPVVIPILPPEQEAAYMERIKKVPGLSGTLRWEDGNEYALPQDFADMLGWKELADITVKAFQSNPDPATVAVYAENYGQAGAIELFGREHGIRLVISFSDNYRYWLPDALPKEFNTLIYVNDELGDDMAGFFEKIELFGEVNMPLSRQHGNQVYVCKNPTPAFFERMNKAIDDARSDREID
ncbi:MAG: glycosyltransferase family 39 protein [Saprospiraceae bacterium]|nr:glycosyltransferase family 39 protein [Saprospiraceae bacterium]